MKDCSQASGYYLRAVVSQMALDGGRTALASELPPLFRGEVGHLMVELRGHAVEVLQSQHLLSRN